MSEIEKEAPKTLLDGAIDFLEATGSDESAIKSKAVGLSLTLLGLAESESKKIKRYVEVAEELERELYDLDSIQAELNTGNMSKAEISKTLTVLRSQIGDAASFIQGTLSRSDIEEISNHLEYVSLPENNDLSHQASKINPKIAEAAKSLLSSLSSNIVDFPSPNDEGDDDNDNEDNYQEGENNEGN